MPGCMLQGAGLLHQPCSRIVPEGMPAPVRNACFYCKQAQPFSGRCLSRPDHQTGLTLTPDPQGAQGRLEAGGALDAPELAPLAVPDCQGCRLSQASVLSFAGRVSLKGSSWVAPAHLSAR